MEKEPKDKGGRPSIYTQELADKVCEAISLGSSLRSACLSKDLPSISTVFKWLREDEGFTKQYEKACEERTEYQREELLDIADDGTNDWEEQERTDGSTFVKLNNESIQRSRLRVDTRKWLMSKMKPKKYGDKMDVTSGGEKIESNAIIFTDFSNEADSQ